jgi:hypothetical protein
MHTVKMRVLRWLHWCFVWMGPLFLVYLTLDQYWGCPCFDGHTAAGRFERTEFAPLLCAAALLAALWLSLPRLHTPRRILLSKYACGIAGAIDLVLFLSMFGVVMISLASLTRTPEGIAGKLTRQGVQ